MVIEHVDEALIALEQCLALWCFPKLPRHFAELAAAERRNDVKDLLGVFLIRNQLTKMTPRFQRLNLCRGAIRMREIQFGQGYLLPTFMSITKA
jgi:hypothetical protein